jgi:bifunctional enzyme CysN/CysC
VQKGDAVTVLPSGKASRVKAIDSFEGELSSAFAPQSVTLRLEDEIDVSRGDMLVHSGDLPRVARTFDAHLVWMQDALLDLNRAYLLKHTTQTVRVDVDRVHWRKDMDTLAETPAATLALNDIGRVTLTAHRELFLDPYETNRETGSFILIDTISNGTVAAGMVIGTDSAPSAAKVAAETTELGSGRRSHVGDGERRARFGTSGGVVLVIGATEAQAESLAYTLERRLFDCAASAVVVAGRMGAGGLAMAAAIRDAGLLAVVATSSELAGRSSLPAALDKPRLLLVGVGVGVDPGANAYRALQARPDVSVDIDAAERGADAVIAALRERGWLEPSGRSR